VVTHMLLVCYSCCVLNSNDSYNTYNTHLSVAILRLSASSTSGAEPASILTWHC
jgi:hypothetical protein